MPLVLKFILTFLSSRFPKLPKCQNKNLNISRTRKAFSSFLKGFHFPKVVSDLRANFVRVRTSGNKRKRLQKVKNVVQKRCYDL